DAHQRAIRLTLCIGHRGGTAVRGGLAHVVGRDGSERLGGRSADVKRLAPAVLARLWLDSVRPAVVPARVRGGDCLLLETTTRDDTACQRKSEFGVVSWLAGDDGVRSAWRQPA